MYRSILMGLVAGQRSMMGERVMLADMQMTYYLGMAKKAGLLDIRPALLAYLDRLQQHPGFRRAQSKGGTMMASADA